MDRERTALKTGTELQLVIAAAHDLRETLAPYRSLRQRRQARVAAGVGTATSAVTGTVMWAANLGFWASVGVALGLGTVTALGLVALAGAGGVAYGLRRRAQASAPDPAERARIELTYCCFNMLAEADGRISEEEQVVLRSVLLEQPLSDDELQAIQTRPADEVLAGAGALDEQTRRQVLRGTWMLAETDGVTPEEEQVFTELAGRLDLPAAVREIKKESLDLQATVNDLVTSMFRASQHALEPALGQPRANEFLEALAHIAATPPVRRNLRNSLTTGFSAGGVGRLFDEHGEAPKVMAQAYNGVRAVFALDGEQIKSGRTRLLELADGSRLGGRVARELAADLDALFDASLQEAGS